MTFSRFLHPRYWFMWLGLATLRLVICLPFSWQWRLSLGLAPILACVVPSRRHVVAVNLKLCFPELSAYERKKMLKQVLANNIMGIFETAMAWWSPIERFQGRYQIKGLEYLQQVQQQGRGVLLVGAHLSMLDLKGFLTGINAEFDATYRPHNNLLFEQFMRLGRQRFSKTLIDNENARTIIKALRNGRTLWFAPDQDMGPSHSIYVPFFGIEAATVTSTSTLARLGRAKVIIIRGHRLDDGTYDIELSPPLEDFPSQDIAVDSQRINKLLEQVIRKKPSQYMWVHRRFKTHPKGKSYLYKTTQI